jgi:membrane protease subunit (stomatin/prohibitin family)
MYNLRVKGDIVMNISKEVIFKGKPQEVIWKSDIHSLQSDSKIFARKDCDIVFLRNGAFIGAFDDKEEYYLVSESKQNFLAKLFTKKEVSENCDIYYVNRIVQLENMWGTPNRIDIFDKTYDLHTSVGANGSYKFSVNNSMKLFSKVMGANEILNQEMVRDFFKLLINMEIRNALATVFKQQEFGLKDIATVTAQEKEIGIQIKGILSPIFDEYGVNLDQFIIQSFNYDDEFLGQIRELKKENILNKMKFDSQKEVRDEARDDFKLVTESVIKLSEASPKQEVHIHQHSNKKFCTQCGESSAPSAKFCSHCGAKIEL